MATALDLNKIGNALSLASPSQIASTPVITPESLAPVKSLLLPTQPTPPSLSPYIASGAATVGANNANTFTTPSGAVVRTDGTVVTPAPAPVKTDTTTDPTSKGRIESIMDAIKKYFPDQPKSAQDTPEVQSAQAAMDQVQADVNNKNIAVKNAQSKLAATNAKLAGITAQIQAITDEATQKNLALENEGGAITTGGVSSASAANTREAAIKAIPFQAEAMAIQAEAIGNQAEVASAQGDQQLAQDLYTQAQQHLDKLYAYQNDAINMKYDYQWKIYDSIKEIATKEQQAEIDKQKTDLVDKKQKQIDVLNLAQTNGDTSTASAILQLDPTSPTFMQDLANLQARIQPKATTNNTININQQYSQAFQPGVVMADGTPTIDITTGKATWKAWKEAIMEAVGRGMSRSDFIKSFGYLIINPDGSIDDNYGLTPVEKRLLLGTNTASGSGGVGDFNSY